MTIAAARSTWRRSAHSTLTATLTGPRNGRRPDARCVLEVFVFVLALGYVWELVDVLARRSLARRAAWTRHPPPRAHLHAFVSLHVPGAQRAAGHGRSRRSSAAALDYRASRSSLIDDNTDDEALWRPVEAWCAEHA